MSPNSQPLTNKELERSENFMQHFLSILINLVGQAVQPLMVALENEASYMLLDEADHVHAS